MKIIQEMLNLILEHKDLPENSVDYMRKFRIKRAIERIMNHKAWTVDGKILSGDAEHLHSLHQNYNGMNSKIHVNENI